MSTFQKSKRILHPKDFQAVRASGIRVRRGMVTLSCLRPAKRSGRSLIPRRLGLVAPKSAGNSVQRNRLKRVAREFFRNHEEFFSEGDVVILFHPGAGICDKGEIRSALAAACKKLGEHVS